MTEHHDIGDDLDCTVLINQWQMSVETLLCLQLSFMTMSIFDIPHLD